jgi:glycosyltransferase involved in cell wall biosynthesis
MEKIYTIKKNSVKKNKRIKKSLIYVGSLEKRKNIFFLINVFYKLYKYDKKYLLTIIGNGPEEAQIKKITKTLKLPVKFLGSKNNDEVLDELDKHSIYVHTSIKESFSLSLLEAKVSGLITVAYKYLQIPNNFVDYPVDEFEENKWFKKKIRIKRNNKKFKYKKYLISNMANKLLKIAK